MSVNPAIGINVPQPHGSWAGYITMSEGERTALNAKFAPQVARFPRLRITSDSSSANSLTANHIWASYLKTNFPSVHILYGTSEHPQYLPTASAYETKILSEIQWANDNNMEAALLGNELELSGSLSKIVISSLVRTSNVVAATTAVPHGLTTGKTMVISGASPADFNAAEPGVSVTVQDATNFTYNSTGSDGSATGTLRLNQSRLGVVQWIKALAIRARAEIVNLRPELKFVYSVSQGYYDKWISEGITPGTDVDKIALNAYGANSFTAFKGYVDAMWAAFGTNMIMTEVNVHEVWSSTIAQNSTPSSRRFDGPYADENMRRVNYCISLGIEEIYWFNAWNASDSINQFTAFYHTGDTSAALQGGWKEIYYRLLGIRQASKMLGTQLA